MRLLCFWALSLIEDPMLVRLPIALLVVFLSLCGVAYGQQAVPKVATDSVKHDFGRVQSGTILEKKFNLGNDGNAPLRIGNLRLSGKGVSVRLQQQIGPGETKEVIAKVDTKSIVGDWRWRIFFNTNDRTRPQITFDLRAYVFLPLEIKPRRLFFSLFDDQTAEKTINIINHLDRPLTITRVEPLGSHFITALETVEAGKRYRIKVTVPEAIHPGRWREAVRIHTDDPEHPTLRVDVNVLVKRDINVFPETVGFGEISAARVKASSSVRELKTQTILVRKRAGDFAITGIKTDIPFLTIETEPKGRAGTFKISIGLDPNKLITGKIKGSLMIKIDDPRFPEINVPVTGEIR